MSSKITTEQRSENARKAAEKSILVRDENARKAAEQRAAEIVAENSDWAKKHGIAEDELRYLFA